MGRKIIFKSLMVIKNESKRTKRIGDKPEVIVTLAVVRPIAGRLLRHYLTVW